LKNNLDIDKRVETIYTFCSKSLLRSSTADFDNEAVEQIRERADETDFVFAWCKWIPFGIESSECHLPVDRSGESVVWAV